MPHRNRVAPWGELQANPARGMFMGNRGILHDRQGRIGDVRWRHRAWVTCRLSFKGRHRRVLSPGRYTELFFLDEATALAAGHRPCGECRRAALHAYLLAARQGTETHGNTRLGDFDRELHRERVGLDRLAAVHRHDIADLPDGTLILMSEKPRQAMLLFGDAMFAWAAGGYSPALSRPRSETAMVLTPPLSLRALRNGYRPAIHPTATVR